MANDNSVVKANEDHANEVESTPIPKKNTNKNTFNNKNNNKSQVLSVKLGKTLDLNL